MSAFDFSAVQAFPSYQTGALTGTTASTITLPAGELLLAVCCPSGETVLISTETPFNLAACYPIAYDGGSGTEEIPGIRRNGVLYLYEANGGTPSVSVGITIPSANG